MKRPNVLLIMMDQLRFDALGYSSNGYVKTPAIDWLKSMSTEFTNAYTPAPSCIPARASLMTGQKPWNTGVLFTGNSAGPDKVGGCIGVNFPATLPGELVKEGYHAEGIGKMHFYPQRATLGFSHTQIDESGREEDKFFCSDYKEWFLKCNPHHQNITDHGIHWNSFLARPFHADECYHPSNWTANQSLDYLRKRDPSKPFMLKMSFSRPHSPYDPSEYFFNMYSGRTDIPQPFESEWGEEKYANSPNKSHLMGWCGRHGADDNNLMRAGYYGSVTQTDNQIGKVLTTLAKSKLLDETMIIFTSDHGDMLGDHCLYRKTYPYEGSSHIPMLIKLPKGYSQVEKVDAPVSLIDIMPTILDVLKIKSSSKMDGISLLAGMCGEKITREVVFSEHIETYAKELDHIMVTNGKFKLVHYFKSTEQELFNLQSSRAENENLISDPTFESEKNALLSHLTKELESWNTPALKFTENGKLLKLADDAEIISPNYLKRLETSPFNWMKETRSNEKII